MSKQPTPAALKTTIVKVLKDNKAIDVTALNIKKLTDIADYMVICTANSTTHAKTLIEKGREKLAEINIRPLSIEGADTREWMIADFNDVVVHVMLEPVREFYALEKLWGLNKLTRKTKVEE